MNDKILLALYVIVLGFIVFGLYELWLMSIIFMLFLIITILQKISIEDRVEKVDKNRSKVVALVIDNLDKISSKVEQTRGNVERSMFILENRIEEVKHTYEKEMENYYRELARKIFDVENRLNSVKKTLGAAYGSIDERLQRIEQTTEKEDGYWYSYKKV